MAIFPYSAGELYQWIVNKDKFVLLDVRNKKDFGRKKLTKKINAKNGSEK